MRRPARLALLLVAWLASTGGYGGCDFFNPAEPEPRRGTTITPKYQTPNQTLEMIALGLEDKGGSNGRDVFLGAFADSGRGDGRAYHGFFDPQDLIGENWGDRDWERELEGQFYNYLVVHPDFSSGKWEMTWEYNPAAGNDEEGLNDALLHRAYRLDQVLESGTRRSIAVGTADLTFVRSAGTPTNWVITVWQDYHAIGATADSVTLGKRRLESQ